MTFSISHAAPLVSVVIPTYNRPAYLKQAIQSVLNQTYSYFELIIADDCSPEDPTPIIESFKDTRLRIRRNKNNLGNGPNIAQAFTLATGKYVASLNDDDYWHPTFLEKLVSPLEANDDVVVAFCDHYIVNADGTPDEAATEHNSRRWRRDNWAIGIHHPFITEALIHQSVSPASSAILRRNAISWDELIPVGVYWDYFLAYLSCRDGLGAYYCPERLTYYRVHSQSETNLSGRKDASAKIRKGESGVYCYSQFLANPNLQPYTAYFRQKWIEANTTLAIGLIKSGLPAKARPYLQSALQHGANIRTLTALGLSFLPSRTSQFLMN